MVLKNEKNQLFFQIENRCSFFRLILHCSISLGLLLCPTTNHRQCKCSGEMPCSRCRRGGVQCTYSTKRKLGRPRGLAATARLQAAHQQACDGKRNRRETAMSDTPSENAVSSAHQFSASPVTGLGGLAESRFLSCFLEHFTPM